MVQTGAVRPEIPVDGSGMTIRIRYRILNARLAAGAVSAAQGGGMDRGLRQFEFQQWVESGYSITPAESRKYADAREKILEFF